MAAGGEAVALAFWGSLVVWGLWAYTRRAWAVFLLLALLPTYLWRGEVFGIPTTWFELALYLAAASYLLHGDVERYALGRVPFRALVGPLLWLGAATLALLVAPDTRLALGVFKGWVVDPLLFCYLLWLAYQRIAEPTRYLRLVVGFLFMGATATSASALVAGFMSGLSRFGAWYDSPNVLAMYLVPSVAAAGLWLYPQARGATLTTYQLYLWCAGVLIVLAGVVATGSYGAWLAVVAAVGVGWLYTKPKWQAVARSAAALAVLVGLLLPWVMTAYGRWVFPGHRNQTYSLTSGQVRLVLWREATRLVTQHPVLGIGLGQWQPVFTSHIQPYLPEARQPGYSIELYYASLFPHNLWLTTWLSLGLLGLAGLLCTAWYVYRAPPPTLPTVVAVALFTAILVQGWFDTPVFKNDLAVLFWLPPLLVACQSITSYAEL